MKDISPILSSIGLQNSEIRTYLSALKLGPSTVIVLAKDTGLSRQATYVAIEDLTKRGLMSSVQHGKKRFFASETPAKLYAYAQRHELEMREKIQELNGLLPQMELYMGGEKPIVRVFEGKEGVREILEDLRETHSPEVFEITDVAAMDSVLESDDLVPLRNELLKKNITVHGLYTQPSREKKIRVNHYVLRMEESNFKSNISIYSDKITMVTFEGKMHSVIIESAALAKAMRVVFARALGLHKK
jgi:sugar-specific transcriptional regulator TrmB